MSFLFSYKQSLSLPLRSLVAFVTSFVGTLLLQRPFIQFLKSYNAAQSIRCFGPQSHLSKAGTPTMGGVLMILCTTVSCFLWADLSNDFILLLLFVLWSYGGIGFVDDYRKVSGSSYKGLSASSKYFLQSFFAFFVILFLVWIEHTKSLVVFDHLLLPFHSFFYYPFGVFGFFFLSYFVLVGSSNAVNLTDGLDGLAISVTILILTFFSILVLCMGHVHTPVLDFLFFVPYLNEVLIFCAAFMGSAVGFLWFNAHPAEIFMGDVGSLSCGAVLGTLALLFRQEFLFFLMSIIFVLETLSVMIQVFSIRVFKKKVFLMAPFHHHFELKGWSETTIVTRFVIVTFCMLIVCFFLFLTN